MPEDLNGDSPTICIFPDYLPQDEWLELINYIKEMPNEFSYLGAGDSPIRFKKVKNSRFTDVEYERGFILDDEEYRLIKNGEKDEPYPESMGNEIDWKSPTHTPIEGNISDILFKILNNSAKTIVKFFGDETTWYHEPFISLFSEGKSLRVHCDGFTYGDEGLTRTDYSTVYYLNDDYEGGEICFPALGMKIKPKANSLLLWSNSWHEDTAHGVNLVTSGKRYVSQGFLVKTGNKLGHPNIKISE